MKKINVKWDKILNGESGIQILKYNVFITIDGYALQLSEAEAGALCSKLNDLLDIENYKDRDKIK